MEDKLTSEYEASPALAGYCSQCSLAILANTWPLPVHCHGLQFFAFALKLAH
jgi:hypothetical protein